jgi:ATP:cob(I)alamin adenosyltransferase
MEAWMGTIEESLQSTTEYFLLPGGTEVAALCHIVRTVIRRAERSLVQLHEEDPVDPSILIYVNRLSDLMFKLARQETHRSGATEERWRLFQPEKDGDA